MKLIAGDIGGTKTDLALYSGEQGAHRPLLERTYASDGYAGLGAIVEAFLAEAGTRADGACFGAAGPVVDDRIEVTNLPWVIDANEMRAQLCTPDVWLLNDLEALAYAVPELRAGDVETLWPGEPQDQGVIAVLAPGTGLGEGYLVWAGRGYRAHPSEGGHADFAPNTGLQRELLAFLSELYGHVSL